MGASIKASQRNPMDDAQPSVLNGEHSAAPAQIQICTFGALQVIRAGYVVTESDWHTRQARQLLKILITERPRPVATDRLIELLWPTSAPAAAATTLRSTVNALRNVLEPQRASRKPSRYILTKTPGYVFPGHADIWLDVDAFEAALHAAERAVDAVDQMQHLCDAVELYQDDYLTSDPYADWAQGERERLRERDFAALLQLAALQAAAGDQTKAIATCRRILARDPVRESAYQALMRYQAEAGDSAAALLTYERCRSLLAEELGADPSPLTQAWHQRILKGEVGPQNIPFADAPTWRAPVEPRMVDTQPTPNHSSAIVLPQRVLLPVLDEHADQLFVGRTAELEQITARLEAALAGQGDILLLAGEAGVGKTRLAYQALHWAATEGATVVSATCQPLERHLPFAPLADSLARYLQGLSDTVLNQLPMASLAQLVQLIPSLQDRLPDLPLPASDLLAGEENRQRLVDGVLALLATLARARPLILFLDDLQWADADTLVLLSRLAQRLPQLPLLLLLAYRTDDLAENEPLQLLLHTLRRTNQQVTLTLARLTQSEVNTYIHHMTQARPAERETLTRFLYATTQGNALFVTEAVRDLLERQAATGATPTDWAPLLQQWQTSQPSPLDLRGNPRVQEVILERIQRLTPTARALLQLCAVIGRDFSLDLLEQVAPQDPLADLEMLLQRKFLVERPDQRLDFSHQIVREVAYDKLSLLHRRRFHRRVADALAQVHRVNALPAEIAFHYRQAGADQHFAHYSILAGERLLRTFGFRQAIDAFDAALTVLENQPDREPEWVRRALQGRGLAYESLFDPAGVMASYRRLQQWARAQGDRQLLLSAHGRLASILGLLGQQRESNELLLEVIETLAATDAVQSKVLVDLFERRRLIYRPDATPAPDGWAAYTPPPPAVTEPVAEILQRLAPTYAVLPLLDYGCILLMQGQLREATHCLQAVVELAKTTGQWLSAGLAYHQLAVVARMQGETDAAHALNEESLAIHRKLVGTPAELASMWPRIGSAFLALQRGQTAEAERRLRQVAAFLDSQDSYRNYQNSTQIGLGLVALARGELSSAAQLLQQALADATTLYPYTHVQALLGLARLAVTEGRQAEAMQHLQRALHFAGERSLVEEYCATLFALADLAPTEAPLAKLIDKLLGYVETQGLSVVAAKVRSVRQGVG
ncbi:MAG: AAA family ATPase [Caldilineaceae bacterium]